MSLHAELSPEARRRLHAQRRNSTISSTIIALLTVSLIAILLGIVLLPRLTEEVPTIVTYPPSIVEESQQEQRKVSTLVNRKPPSPSSSMARVIAANTTSPTAIPVPELDVTTPSLDFGSGSDFGEGWDGTGAGEGSGGGGGGGFGSTSRSSGGLEGWLYDFKQKPDGREIAYDLGDRSEFVDRAVRLQRSDFSEASLSRHFRAPNSLFLTHLAIPFSNASDGPKFFGAEDSIKPSGWIAHYRGKIIVPKSGTYRFSGFGDDYIVVMLNGRMRLVACWPDIQDSIRGRWKPSEPTGAYQSPIGGQPLVFGDWVNLKEGQTLDFGLAIGERPGGKVGFVLQIEEKGVEYRTAPDGRPILPLFTTVAISDEERSRITGEFGSYEFEWEQAPVFRHQ